MNEKQEQLSDLQHLAILNNEEADMLSRMLSYFEYCTIGFAEPEARDMAGVPPDLRMSYEDFVKSLQVRFSLHFSTK